MNVTEYLSEFECGQAHRETYIQTEFINPFLICWKILKQIKFTFEINYFNTFTTTDGLVRPSGDFLESQASRETCSESFSILTIYF